jgi:uroporphyrinogen-III synthase
VGRATAAALSTGGLAPDLVPEHGFDSEALVALPALTDVQHRRVLIVRGVGGRALLGEILAERGAQVSFAEVYRRSIPRADVGGLIPEWRQTLGFITASSDEVLQNLCSMVPAAGHPWLHSLPLAVMSERGGVTAMQLGFRTVAVASETSDAGILDALCRLALGSRPAP